MFALQSLQDLQAFFDSRLSHQSIKPGDMRGGFDSLHRMPHGRRRR